MRKLSEKEAAALARFAQQRRQLRRIEQLDRACSCSNELIDRIVHDVGEDDAALMSRMMTLKAANYNRRVHIVTTLRFVQKLVAVSTRRVHTIEELQL